MWTEIDLKESEIDLNEFEHFRSKWTEVDLNKCEHFLKVNWDRSKRVWTLSQSELKSI